MPVPAHAKGAFIPGVDTGRRKVVREGASQAAVTGEEAGWRVRRRRLPGPRSPPGPEPAVRTLPGWGSRASRGRARRAAAGKKVGAAPRDARASFMNAPCRVGCQGTGRPTGIPGPVKTWPRGARGGPWHAPAAVVRGILAMSCLPELARLAFSLDNARVRRRAGRHGGLRDPRRPVVSAVATVRKAPAVLGVALALGGAWHAVLILVFLVAVLWADEIAHASARALSAALGAAREQARQRRELDRRWLELARQARPVPSAHERPEDVRDLAGTLVARLCPECEAQVPPDFEVLKGNR